MLRPTVIGRGASFNPKNRFEEIQVDLPPEDLARYFEDPEPGRKILTKFYFDHTRSVLARNDSPDLGFTYSINPYRGCEHGCVYCYARPTHEYLGFSSGLDFETKILVKPDAASLLAGELDDPGWEPQVVVFSGDTDCYQPVERKLGITRRCLEVFLRFRNPVSVITKNALVQRDVDLLKELAGLNLVFVIITVTTLDGALARTMEPRTSAPAVRLETVEFLARHGVPVGVNVAPVIPGLNDAEIFPILREAARRGARYANYSILRLPYAVKDLFLDWLERTMPQRAHRIVNRIREVRDGKLSCSEFGKRMKGEGELARAIDLLFASACRRLQLNRERLRLSTEHFRRPGDGQLEMF